MDRTGLRMAYSSVPDRGSTGREDFTDTWITASTRGAATTGPTPDVEQPPSTISKETRHAMAAGTSGMPAINPLPNTCPEFGAGMETWAAVSAVAIGVVATEAIDTADLSAAYISLPAGAGSRFARRIIVRAGRSTKYIAAIASSSVAR